MCLLLFLLIFHHLHLYYLSYPLLPYVYPQDCFVWGPEFRDSLPLLVSCYVLVYSSYLNALHFTYMTASDSALTGRDRYNVLHDTEAEGWVKHLLRCGGHGISVLGCIGSKVDCPFFSRIKFGRIREGSVNGCAAFHGQQLSETGPLLVVLCR